MGFLGLSSQQEYDDLAEKLRTYEGAEQFAIEQLAPVVNTMADFLYPSVFGAAAYIGLSYYILSLSPVRVFRYFLSLVFVVVLMHPVSVGNARVPWSLYYFNKGTTYALGLLQSVIDKSIKTPGGPGNFAATMYPLSAYSSGAGGDDLHGTELARVVRVYNTTCGNAVLRDGKLTMAELRAVGLGGGALGVDVPGTESARASALQKMRGLEDAAATPEVGFHTYYQILSRSWWLGREGDKNQAPKLLVNNIPEIQYCGLDGSCRPDSDKTRFYANDCAGLWRIADMSVREYQSAVAVRSKVTALRAGIAPDDDKDGLVVLGAQLTAAQKVSASNEKKEKSIGASIANALVSGIESLVVTFAMKAVNWFAEIVTKFFVFAVPAVAALAVGLMFVAWPVYVCMALIPGRERSIPQFLSYNVFIKAFLFFSYAILKIGGALFLAALNKFARDGDASLASMTFIGGLAILIGVLYGGTALAQAVTFAQAGGLAGALGLGGVGGAQITRAAQMITQRSVNLVSSPRSGPGPDPRRNLAPSRGRGAPPRGTPPVMAGTQGQGGRPVTVKQLRDRLNKK